jgi:hypothetical protein
VLFVRNDGLRFTEAGELQPHTAGAAADGCRASCVDWYGNARPLFLRGRLIALLGYELVEGRLDEGRIVEGGGQASRRGWRRFRGEPTDGNVAGARAREHGRSLGDRQGRA